MSLRSLVQHACRVAPAVALVASLCEAQAAPTGLQADVVFSEYTPLSESSELVRRVLSPLAAAHLEGVLAHSSGHLLAQSIDLSAERFALYVPAAAPPQGYGLLVFVPPWQEARVPAGWEAVLDRYGIIYASAARSGNEEDVIGRREPLALLALHNVRQRYPVDGARVYVGGFSGGSRIALRLALAYPDVFRGALLNAGSDPLGAGVPPLPPADLFRRFQESMRLIYVTGEQDRTRLTMDVESEGSMRQWCVNGVDVQVTRGAAHELAGPNALAEALHELQTPARADPAKLARCRAGIDADLAAQLGKVQALIGRGQRAEAQKRLLDIDKRFGGLAAPRTIELQMALDCNPADERARARCEQAGSPAASGDAFHDRSLSARREERR
jgi:poly(3-hydroxybutyrate) depolymerase